jgi:hypothetical protein
MDKEVLLQYLKEIESSYELLIQHIEEFGTDEEYNDFYHDCEDIETGINNLEYFISKIKTT